MRIFVTGATGVVGRRVVPLLLEAGHGVTAVARGAEKARHLEQVGARPAFVDLFDAEKLVQAVRGHDAVINLATRIPPSSRALLPGSFRENDRIRRTASLNLVSAALAAGADRFIQESFAPTYPDSGNRWIDESTPLRPARYARTVLDAEREANRFTAEGGAGVVLRFAFFYGPDSGHTLDTIRFVRKGIAPFFGRPDGYLSSIHTHDAATAVAAALAVPAGTYNVADDEPLRRSEFFAALAGELGVRPPRILPGWMSPLMGSLGDTLSRSLRISNARLKRESGWAPAYPSAREGWAAVCRRLGTSRDATA